jgi:hypothetical protein
MRSLLFLIAHGFNHSNTKGDDAVYVKSGWNLTCKVTLNKKSTPMGTIQQIKRCSGYSNKVWIDWWKNNGFGE